MDGLRVAVFVLKDGRVVYQNATGRTLLERLRRDHGVEFPVTLRDHLTGLRRPIDAPVPVVTLLTPPSGASLNVHARRLPSRREQSILAVSVHEVDIEREALRARYGLSGREMQVLELILRGHGNRDIAATLGIAVGTAKKHLTRIFDKVGVDSRLKLFSRAVC